MNQYLYQQSRDSAWQFLVRVGAQELPVKLAPICNFLHIRLCRYQAVSELLQKMELTQLIKEAKGFINYERGEYTIFYDDSFSAPQKRVTIAHELGHIVLGHVVHAAFTQKNRLAKKCRPLDEQAADAFAARLLAPACVLHFARITTAAQIEEVCQISHEFAQYRANRLADLKQRDAALFKEHGKGCFFRSELEEAVYVQFQDYINIINPDFQKEAR